MTERLPGALLRQRLGLKIPSPRAFTLQCHRKGPGQNSWKGPQADAGQKLKQNNRKMDRLGQDVHRPKSKHLIPAGFSTFQGTLLHGLFNSRFQFKALQSGTQRGYLIHSVTRHMCGEPATNLSPACAPLHATERAACPCLPPAPPTCTDCLGTSGSARPIA